MKLTRIWLFAAFASLCILGGCKQSSTSNNNGGNSDSLTLSSEELAPKYATGYQVKDSDGVRLVDVGKDYHFALVTTDDAKAPEGYTKVRVPIKNTICMTALQLSNFTILNAHDVVK